MAAGQGQPNQRSHVSAMTINGQKKGARGEREFASFIREQGWDAIRGCQNAGRDKSGHAAPDVLCPDLPIHFEVKRVEKLQIRKALSQAIADAEPGQVPVVAWRENHSDWVAILKMDDLMNFVREFVISTQEKEPAPERADSTQNEGY